jgi:hypothetical protein
MPAHRDRRRSTDMLSVSRMTPTAKAALDLIASEPGISVADLGDRLGVSMGRTWQIVNILQYDRVRLSRDYAAERARRAASRK